MSWFFVRSIDQGHLLDSGSNNLTTETGSQLHWETAANYRYPQPDAANYTESTLNPALRTEFESGYVHSRRRVTVAKKRWTMQWSVMSNTHFRDLLTHFNSHQGGSFNFRPPDEESVVYIARYGVDQIDAKSVAGNRWGVKVILEEV